MKYAVLIEQSGPDSFCADSPDVPGCVATGATAEEALACFQEVLSLHIKLLREAGQEIPRPTTLVGAAEIEDPEVA